MSPARRPSPIWPPSAPPGQQGGIQHQVGYRLYRVGDRWMLYDVTVEGVSLVANYRAQFNKIIQTSSAQGLVEKLRAKQE